MRWFLLFALCALAVDATRQAASTGKYDRYGGIRSLAGTKTGWFHTREIAGRWYSYQASARDRT